MKQLFLSILISAIIISCGPSTKIEKSWMEPGSSVTPGPGNKTLVVAMIKDETSRRVVEDQLAKRLGGGAVSSYTIVSTDMLKTGSEDALKQKVTEG